MTFAQQLKQQGLQQGREEGRHEEALIIARNLLADSMSPQAVQRLTGLSEREVMNLIDKH
jgi:recombination-promoting nuclease RpnB